MSRLAHALILLFTFCVSTSAIASAGRTSANGLPYDATMVQTYEWADGVWIEATGAVSYYSDPGSGHCDRRCWDITIESQVAVFQWIEWDVHGTRSDLRALRPGTFASKPVKARVRSNDTVRISLWMENPSDLHAIGIVPPIARSFSHSTSDTLIEDALHSWKRADDYPAAEPFTIIVPDGPMLRSGVSFNVWEMIEVSAQHDAEDYYGNGIMLICVSNLMHWVDSEVGGFDPSDKLGLVL